VPATNLTASHPLDFGEHGGLWQFFSFYSLNIKGLGVLSFPILLNTEGRCCNVNGYNLLNTDDFELDIALSPLPFSASSTMMYCVGDHLSLCRLKFSLAGMTLANANPWCYKSVTLSLYHFCMSFGPRLCCNDVHRRWWFAEVITKLLH